MVHTNISQHLVDESKSYLFDTNIWLLLFNKLPGKQFKQRRLYIDLLKDIQHHHANIYVTSIILSEYINRSLRMGFNEWKTRVRALPTSAYGSYTLDFKRDYRPTDDYSRKLQEVIFKVHKILNTTVRHPDEFDTIDVDNLLGMMGQSCDYNDAYLVKCCESGSMILVSDDKDVKSFPGNICLVSAR